MTAGDLLINLVISKIPAAVEPKMSAMQALNQAVRALTQKLIDRNSDLVKGFLSVNSTTSQTVKLPSDFNGFKEDPYINGKPLDPLRTDNIAIYSVSSPGIPKQYMVLNTVLYLFPTPASSQTIKGVYWKMPAEISDMDDAVPYTDGTGGNRLENIIANMVIEILVSGVLSAEFSTAITASLDSFIFSRLPVIPRSRPGQFF